VHLGIQTSLGMGQRGVATAGESAIAKGALKVWQTPGDQTETGQRALGDGLMSPWSNILRLLTLTVSL
jgi:hypothetical protein